jgi:hypothetical protein
VAAGGSAGSAGTAAAVVPPCFDPDAVTSVCTRFADSPLPILELAHADEIAVGARFSRMGAWGILAELPAKQAPRLVVIREPTATTADRILVLPVEWPEAVGAYRIVDIWSLPGSEIRTASEILPLALGCDEEGCSLLSGTVAQTMRISPGTRLPRGVFVDGLAVEYPRVCAFGDGVFCLTEQGWVEELPPSTRRRITALRLGEISLAGADDGAVFVQRGKGWELAPVSLPAAVSYLSSASPEFTAFSTDGSWHAISGELQETGRCAQAAPVGANEGFSSSGPWVLAASDGRVFYQNWSSSMTYEWCAMSMFGLGDILDASVEYCGAALNVFAITSERVLSLLAAPRCYLD